MENAWFIDSGNVALDFLNTRQYVNGRLRVEARDTNDDGRLDRFDRFDDRGRVVMQEEDRNADGRIDVRSIYRAGKLVRREFSDPDHIPDDT